MSTSFDLKLTPSLPDGRYVSTIVQTTKNVHLNERYTRSTGVKSFFTSARKTGTTLLMGMLIVVMGFLGLVQASAPAQAFDPLGIGTWLDNNFCSPESRFRISGPEVYGSGALLMVGGSGELAKASGLDNLTTAGDKNFLSQRRTAYEKYGVTGARWQNYRPAEVAVKRTNEILGISDRPAGDRRKESNCFDPVSEVGNYFANFVFDGTKLVVLFTTWFYGAVYQPDFVDSINDAVGTIITGEGNSPGLKDILYFEFINLVLLFSALYLGWIGLVKKQSTQAMSAGLWMFSAVMVGSLLMWNPTFLPNATNSLISQVEMALMRGTTGVALGISTSNPQENMCYAPNAAANLNDTLPMNNPGVVIDRNVRAGIEGQKDQVIRSMECVIWATFVYTPWVSGQFGMSPTAAKENLKFIGDETGPVNLGGDSIITGNVAFYQLDQQSLDRTEVSDPDARLNNIKNWFTVVAESFWAEEAPNAAYADVWSGTADPGSRIGVAFLSLISASVGLASIMVISLSILMYSVAMSLLMFISVIFLLIGAHPGMGRGISLRWAEMYVGTIFKRLIASALLGMIMAFYAVILASDVLSFGTSLIAIVALSIAAISYRKTIMDAFTSFSFGGTNAGIENSQGFKKAGGAAGGAVLGAAAVIGGGAAMGAASSAKGAALASGASRSAAARAGAGGAFKAIGAGSFRAAKAGAVSGRLDGAGAMLASQQADAAGRRTQNKYDSKTHRIQSQQHKDHMERKNAEFAAANQKREEAERKRKEAERNNPSALSARRRAAENRKRKYEEDYAAYHESQDWRDSFTDTYGFAPYNPADAPDSGFGGYGLHTDSQDYAEAESWRESERAKKAREEAAEKAKASAEAAAGGSNGGSNGSNKPGSHPSGGGKNPEALPPPSDKPMPRPSAKDFSDAEEAELEARRKRNANGRPNTGGNGNGGNNGSGKTDKPLPPPKTQSNTQAELKAARANQLILARHEQEARRRQGNASTPEEQRLAKDNLAKIRRAIEDNRTLMRNLELQYKTEK